MKFEQYNPEWENIFKEEAELIRSVLDEDVIDIEHIGSTAIRSILSKPIIDIAALVSKEEYLQVYTPSLSKIGYTYHPESSSVERLFFRKGDPVKFHLSLSQEGKTTYWERQLVFRDYLNSHLELVKEYQILKLELQEKDPSFGPVYSEGKTEFVRKVLGLAKID